MDTIIVSAITTVGVVITTLIQSKKERKKDNIEAKLDNIRKEFNDSMDSLKDDLNQETLARCKADLVSLMSKIKNGYTPTVEEKMILHESKKKYNGLGGDSYVDEMFDNLVKEGKI